jgi:zinc protease
LREEKGFTYGASRYFEKRKIIAEKYIIPNRMYYVVVGDAATQLKPPKKIGFGKPILITQ